MPGRLSLIQLSVTATPDSVKSFIAKLGERLRARAYNGIKQFAEAEGPHLQPDQRAADVDGAAGAVSDVAVRDGGHEQRGRGTQERCGLDEGDWRIDPAGGAAIPDGSDSVGDWRRADRFGGGALLVSIWLGKAVFGVAAAAAMDCVSYFCDHLRCLFPLPVRSRCGGWRASGQRRYFEVKSDGSRSRSIRW